METARRAGIGWWIEYARILQHLARDRIGVVLALDDDLTVALDVVAALEQGAQRFSSGDQDLAQWSEHKRKVNAGKSWIKVGLSRVSMMQYPRENFVVVNFVQDYRSSNLSNVMRKRQYWIKDDGRWRILYEGGA